MEFLECTKLMKEDGNRNVIANENVWKDGGLVTFEL